MKYITLKDLIWFTLLVGCLWFSQESKSAIVNKLNQEIIRLKQTNQYIPSSLTVYEP